MNSLPKITAQIVWLYYDDLEVMHNFYHHIMGFELVEDQGWAKIYRVTNGGFIGAVDGNRGHFPVREENSVAIALVVSDVISWHDHLAENGIRIKTKPDFHDGIQVESFFALDPGGYTFEIQRFAKPQLVNIFH